MTNRKQCDRCGALSTDYNEKDWLTIGTIDPEDEHILAYTKKDLCPQCTEKLRQFLNKPEGT